MGTNKDQLQAHQFMLQRVISALAVQETDPEQPPFRRPTMAMIGAIVIGILSCAGVWVFGLLVPGGNKFTATDVIAVEEETGARFVLMNGQLHPALNYTSALLALDRHAEVRIVSHATLAGIPAGAPIGIPDAPDSLPGKDQLLTGGWSVCNQSIVDKQGQRKDVTTLLVGHLPEHGAALAGQGLLVRAGNREYLIYHGYRHEVTRGVDVALQLGSESVVEVDGAWLDTVPPGAPIGPVPVAKAGSPSTAVPGMELVAGQLLEVDDDPGDVTQHQFYLVLTDQLVPISPLQAMVQRVLGPHADPAVMVRNRALTNAVRAQPQQPKETDTPRNRPRFAPVDDPNAAVCAVYQPGDTVPRLIVDASLSAADRAVPDGPIRVAVPAGKAALVEVMSSADALAGQGTVALVTDQGRLYPLADPQHVQQVLGYDGVAPVRITGVLANRIPLAHALSPDAARLPVAPR